MLRTLLVIAFFGSGFALPAIAAKKVPAEKPAAKPPEPAEAAPAPEGAENVRRAAPPRITGTFSTLQSFGDGGDLVGVEVMIVGSRDGLFAIVQTADGVVAPPVIVPVALDGSDIAFPIPGTTGQPIEFKGRVTRQGLTGTLDGRPFTLPRRKSHWQ